MSARRGHAECDVLFKNSQDDHEDASKGEETHGQKRLPQLGILGAVLDLLFNARHLEINEGKQL